MSARISNLSLFGTSMHCYHFHVPLWRMKCAPEPDRPTSRQTIAIKARRRIMKRVMMGLIFIACGFIALAQYQNGTACPRAHRLTPALLAAPLAPEDQVALAPAKD